MIKLQYLIILVFFVSSIGARAQERIFVDFGSGSEEHASQSYYNNISSSVRASQTNGVLLFNEQGSTSGINLKVHDAWLNINQTGTQDPDNSLAIPKNASRDNFFGSTNGFNGNTEVTGGFKLRSLDSNKFYSISLFASRINVTDNRETSFTVNGSTSQNVAVNASNNTTQTAIAYNIQPDSNGEITIVATAGPNNSNSNGFYYLNSMELQVSQTPISQLTTQTVIELTYPVNTATWEIGKTVEILWRSENYGTVTLSYSTDGGSTFSTIATVPATDSRYDFIVPNQITNNAIIRIANGSQIIDSLPIEIIPNDGVVYKIVVLGSSTAAGSGPSHRNNAWVWKYRNYLYQLDTRYEIVNLARGGFVTYNIIPTGSSIPTGVTQTIDIDRNIDEAINLQANGIIINLPSNDASNEFPVTDQLNNYNAISQLAAQNQIPLWVTTPQPRNFGNNANKLAIQQQMVTSTHQIYQNNAIDFWTGLGITNGNGLLTQYDSGDLVHATNEAHQIFFDRLLLKNVHGQIKTAVDAALNITDVAVPQINFYPNPVKDKLHINTALEISKIQVYNQIGQLVLMDNAPQQNIDLQNLETGFYVIHFSTKHKSYHFKFIKE